MLPERHIECSSSNITAPAAVIQSRSEKVQSNKDVPAAITGYQAKQAFIGQQSLSHRLEITTCDSPDHQLGSSHLKHREDTPCTSPDRLTNVDLIMRDVQDVGSSGEVMADSEQKDFASDDACLKKVARAGSNAHITSAGALHPDLATTEDELKTRRALSPILCLTLLFLSTMPPLQLAIFSYCFLAF